jgi:transposase
LDAIGLRTAREIFEDLAEEYTGSSVEVKSHHFSMKLYTSKLYRYKGNIVQDLDASMRMAEYLKQEINENELKKFSQILNENTIDSFKYNAVKRQIQKAINNQSLSLQDISPNKYFIVCFDLFNNNVSMVSTSDKSDALKHIEYYKNMDNVWKIYVEKPSVDAIVFLRKEWGWIKK